MKHSSAFVAAAPSAAQAPAGPATRKAAQHGRRAAGHSGAAPAHVLGATLLGTAIIALSMAAGQEAPQAAAAAAPAERVEAAVLSLPVAAAATDALGFDRTGLTSTAKPKPRPRPAVKVAAAGAVEQAAPIQTAAVAPAPAVAEPAAPGDFAAAAAPGRLMSPLAQPVLTSPFGYRASPITGMRGELHTGQDFAAGCGTPVTASAAGTVVFAGWHAGGGGNRVVVDHGNGLQTTYNHLAGSSVAVGQAVGKAGVIGSVGTTGASTGCHLHFEVVLNGAVVDPAGWL